MKPRHSFFSSLPFQFRLISIFFLTSVLSLCMSLFLNQNINRSLETINSIYTSNDALNKMSSSLASLQASIQEYLETKSTDSLNEYYQYEQQYKDLLSWLNTETMDNNSGSMEKNIYNISQSYLDAADLAIEAKRARNTGRYRTMFQETSRYYQFLTSYIFSLNNRQFVSNSASYHSLAASLILLERINFLMTIAMALFNIFLIIILVRQITKPIIKLAEASDQVAAGHFDVELPQVTSSDEIGAVTLAFNQMITSIRDYIDRLKSSMEAEKKAQERELLMETHLKDAQLKYYQAQINPHFLFNSLNAGAQMAMMEDAEKTYSFIQNMADFFRYSMKSLRTDVYLSQEVELVENYLAIMNVRFSGEIHFEKTITCDISGIQVPCMILQPAVENAIQYGLRNISWPALLRLEIEETDTCIRIRIIDNGCGISEDRLIQIRNGSVVSASSEKNSNGIGLGNVQERLKLYYNREDLFSIESEGENKGTTVTIRVPLN
ncbi:MAG: histidine kinase [Lachnospiraceae bacterium]|nr:histidine kinase [Lachnospiraceae bacterium]